MQGHSPCSHQWAYPAHTRGSFRFTTKVTKGVSGGAPLNPLGGHYHPPSGVAAPPRRTLPLGVGGGVGLCFPPRRIGVSGCRYPFLYSGKNCWMPGGEYGAYIADRGRLGGSNYWVGAQTAPSAQSRRCISPFTNTPHLAQKLHADVQLFHIFLQFLLGEQVFASYPGIGCPCAHNPRAQKRAAPLSGTAFFSIFCLYNSSVL